MFSSWLLKDSFRYCTQTSEEGMHFVAGIEVDDTAIATRIIPFRYARRSIASAVGDHRDTHRAFIDVQEAEHRLLALVHSHPGTGSHANHPSGEDLRTQKLWELGNKMIGGIWSRLRSIGSPRGVFLRG